MTAPSLEEKISLYCKNATSDKEYHVQLVAAGDLFLVHYQNGKRGGTLQGGLKTATPVDYAKAKAAYDKAVKERFGKGYTRGQDGAAFSGTPLEERVSGILAQLLNAITEEEAEQYLRDPDWVLQEKYDGHHKLVRQAVDELIGINKKGLVTGLPDTVRAAVLALRQLPALTLDGELMGPVLVIFDVLEHEGVDLRPWPYSDRLQILERIAQLVQRHGITHLFVAPTARTEEEKRALYAKLKEQKREGGVFKRLDAPYTPGKPSSGGPQLKRPFTQRDSFIVLSRHATKRSIELGVINEEGITVDIGACLVPTNYPLPAVADIVDVEYKHVFIGGKAYQSRYKGQRIDVSASECLMSRLRFKPVPDDADEDDAE